MVVFFFGAGAEVGYKLSNGEDFAKSVLGINTDDMNKAIKDFYSNKLTLLKENKWYPHRYYSSEWEVENLLKACIKKKFLADTNFDHKRDYDNLLSNELEIIKKLDKEEQNKFIDHNTSYMGLIDEYFHTLVSPVQLGPKKFWGVVNCYTRAYLTIVSNVLCQGKPTSEMYKELLCDPKDTYEKVVDKCRSLSDIESYYSINKKHFTKNDYGIITTNYTPLCSLITGCENTAHIHGKLNLFESPYENKVYDVTNEDFKYPKDLIFPFLFIQSGIKPIIEYNQLKEYSKMLKLLEDAQTLIIVGYRLNLDDNHLNSLIRNFITDKKKNNHVIFFDFEGEKKNTLIKDLRLIEHPQNLEIKEINSCNCMSEFERVVETIKRRGN